MIWGNLEHLGYNMWLDEARWNDGRQKRHNVCVDHLLCTDKSWTVRMNRLKEPVSSINLLVIDVGEGVVYPSHPEIAVRGSWTPEKLNAEVKALKAAGIEVVPKLNFSAAHHFWLGDYARMLSSRRYYEVVKDLIDDTVEIFEHPRHFHIGMDEEGYRWCMANAYCVFRNEDLWWHDIAFYGRCIERHNCRPWMFSNVSPGKDIQQHASRLPKSFLHSPCTYVEVFEGPGMQDFVRRRLEFMQLYDRVGLEMAPICSTWCGEEMTARGIGVNLKNTYNFTKWCKEHISPEHLAGMQMIPWTGSTEATDGKFLASCDIMDITRESLFGWKPDYASLPRPKQQNY